MMPWARRMTKSRRSSAWAIPAARCSINLAAQGNPKAIRFPRTLLDRDSLDFSFSGIKTAVLYHVRGVPQRAESAKAEVMHEPPLSEMELRDIAASFQAACIDVMIEKLNRAVQQFVRKVGHCRRRGFSQSWTARHLQKLRGPRSFSADLRYCTDNAAMSAGLAHLYFQAGRFSELNLDAITYSQFAATCIGFNVTMLKDVNLRCIRFDFRVKSEVRKAPDSATK